MSKPNLWELIEQQQKIDEAIQKYNAINWMVDNVQERYRPELEIKTVGSALSIGEKYFFFFRGNKIKSVLKRKNMKRSCNWLCNGQPSKNTKCVYWSN